MIIILTALMNGKKVLATDPAWDNRKEEYRTLCNEKALCPICNEPIICKFGEINQHHFAHRHTSNCPGDHDTAEHMQGKMILYDFLRSRFEHEATIDMEHYFPEIKMTCDFLIEFKDGRQWVVEFHCGINKQKELKTKIEYYSFYDINVTWLLSKDFYEKFQNSGVKIALREQSLIFNTGIDKLHMGSWYEHIIINRNSWPLPTDQDSLGSLMYLDVKQKEITIIRAIRRGMHLNTFYYGAMLCGPLDEICIIYKNSKWGIIWYFSEEKELWPKFEEAKKVLQELKNKDLIEQKLKSEAEAEAEAEAKKKEASKKQFSGNSQHDLFNTYSARNEEEKTADEKEKTNNGWQQENYYDDNGWHTTKHLETYKYRCIYCGREFYIGDMVSIPHYNESVGTCRECRRNGYTNLKGRI